MPKHVLVPVDGSPQSSKAVEFAVGEWPDAELTLLNVINPVDAGYSPTAGVPSGAEEWFEEAKANAERVLAAATPTAAATVHTRTEVGRPSQTIVEVAEEGDIDHVVMGSHGRKGVSRILLGSVAEAVIRNSTVPVTVVR
ncbi:Nucleotide-binding universal stress protein, UspA family [Halogranum gelatinilyticum]|uniref:Nucleotide-binding universal stress protein, UspA family n=1 Tax=Halogranum gelatinilyticum TaxID=660521 RepID=A0A1G9U5L5_9EURY|nr:universal stress protein [Halogranum gelatinilyticum]SDM55103.1 Nucleotide-binding universal stress protein, UspA family [Halogranum gelatinilyticum]